MIDPDAIQKFLDYRPKRIPTFKGTNPEHLHRIIEDTTGIKFNSSLTEPRPWQLEGITFSLYTQRALLFYSMRLGKTAMALNWAEHLQRAGLWKGKGIVIAHAPIGLDVWQGEAEKHSLLKLYPVRTSPHQFCDALESDADLIVTPWSGLQAMFSTKRCVTRGRKAGQAKLYPDYELIRLAREHFSLCILDEIHFCKNHKSLRFKIASALLDQCWFRLGLTGTPIGRDPFALWSQAYLIDKGETLGKNYFFFQEAFGTKKKDWFAGEKWTFNKSKMPILQRKLEPLALSYKFEEVHNVEVLEGIIELEMKGEQLKVYQDVVEKTIKLHEKKAIEIQNNFMKLRQIASGFLPFVDEDGKERIVNFHESAKLDWIEDFFSQLEKDTQAVIFHEFIRSGSLICSRLNKLGISHSWLYGRSRDRSKELKDFQSRQAQVMVVNSATGGAGIDLSMADYLCFFESPVDPIVRQQAEARPMARTTVLLRDDLVCAPIERRILSFVKEGKDLLKEILRNPGSLR